MANTRDVLGDRQTMEALIADTLEEYEDSDIGSLNNESFSRHRNLKSVSLPNLVTIGSDAFEYDYELESVYLPNLRSMGSYLFNYCSMLTEVSLDNITSLGSYMFNYSGIGKVVLPLCTSLGTEPLRYSRVGTFDLYKKVTISSEKFNNAYSLTQLILRSEELCPMTGDPTNTFKTSPIGDGVGWIYVPSALVTTYKKAEGWEEFADQIVSIDEYPKPLQDETIEDSWEEIFASIDNGSYADKYDIGFTKYVEIGGTWLPMEIAAIDKDISPSGDIVPITWISKTVLQDCPFNSKIGRSRTWANSNLRNFLRTKIYQSIDPVVRNRIVEVTKTTNNGSTTSSNTETIWIPSFREMVGYTTTNYCEPSGIDYVTTYGSNTLRKKKRSSVLTYASPYYLRTTTGATTSEGTLNAVYIDSNGSNYNTASTYNYGVVIGFCT